MTKHLLAGLATLVVGLTAACTDAPSAPAAPASNPLVAFAKGGNGNGKANGPKTGTTSTSSTDSLVAYLATLPDTLSRTAQPVVGMKRLAPLTGTQTASATIDANGGMVELPTAGAYLWVPPGAVSAATTFSITALPGKAAAYDFQPAGAVFAIPLVLIQDKAFLDPTIPTGFNTAALGYFGSEADVDQTTANATASQLRLPLSFSTAQYVAFPVWHFSGYIVSWGRQ
jgi:hypothetical protein